MDSCPAVEVAACFVVTTAIVDCAIENIVNIMHEPDELIWQNTCFPAVLSAVLYRSFNKVVKVKFSLLLKVFFVSARLFHMTCKIYYYICTV